MKSAKQETLEVLEQLPDDAPLDEIAWRLHLRAKVLHSRDQAERGELIPNDEVMEDLRRWQQSSGR